MHHDRARHGVVLRLRGKREEEHVADRMPGIAHRKLKYGACLMRLHRL